MSEYAHKVLAPKLSPEQRKLLFKYFTEFFSDGFESGDFSAWTSIYTTGGTVTVVESPVYLGTYAAKFDATGNYGCAASKTLGSVYSTLYFRAYVYFEELSSSDGSFSRLLQLRLNDGTNIVCIGRRHVSGQPRWGLRYLDGSQVNVSITSPLPETGQWHCVEIKGVIDSSVGEVRAWIDGIELFTYTGINTGSTSMNRLTVGRAQFDYTADIGTTYMDCVIVADEYIEGEDVSLPTTIGTTTENTGTRTPPQSKQFYAKELFWCFYSNGSNIVYRVSPDGEQWSSANIVCPIDFGAYFSLVLEDSGDYFHYSRNNSDTTALYYRKGQLNTNGTITWSAAEQTVGSTGYFTDPVICLDSNDYPWITYSVGDHAVPYYPYVTASTTKDGTWTTKSGYPLQLNDVDGLTTIVSLTNGKLYAAFHSKEAQRYIYGKLYNGTSWGSLEQCSTTTAQNTYYAMFCVTSIGDDVHLVFLSSGNNVVYVKRTYGTGWGSEETVQSSVSDRSTPVISHYGTRLYVAWCNSNHVYYKTKNGTWSDLVDWIDESTDTFPINDTLGTYLNAYDVKIGFMYETRASSPYNVRFNYIVPEAGAETYTKTWTTDALFKKLGIPKSLDVDAAFQKQDIPKTFGLDATFQKSFIIQKQIDSLFKRFDILKSFAVDARFGALMTQTISRQIDVLLKKLDLTKNFGLDVYFGPFEAETYAKTFALDAIFAYKVRLPELWLDENGKIVLNISKPYTWVGS